MSDELISYLQSLGGNAGPASERTMEALKERIQDNTDGNKDGWKGMKDLGRSIKKIAGGASQAVGDIATFGRSFTKEQMKFTQTLSKLGLDRIGAVNAVSELIGQLEDNIDTFRNLSQNGILFNDRITSLQTDIAKLGVSSKEFETYLRGNSEALALQGNASKGAAKTIEQVSLYLDNYAGQLQAFGLDFGEMNETYFKFLNRNAYALRFGNDNLESFGGRAAEYAKSLRRLTNLTGLQADQIQSEVDKYMTDANLQLAMASETQNTRDNFRILNDTLSGFSEAAVQGSSQMMAGYAPFGEMARGFFGIAPGLEQVILQLQDTARKSNMTQEEYQRLVFQTLTKYARDNEQFAKDNAKINFAITQSGGRYATHVQDFAGAMMRFARTPEEVEEMMKKAGKGGNEMFNGMMQMERATRDVRIGFGLLSERLYGSKSVQAGFDTATKAVDDFSKKLRQAADNKEAGKIIEDLADLLFKDNERFASMQGLLKKQGDLKQISGMPGGEALGQGAYAKGIGNQAVNLYTSGSDEAEIAKKISETISQDLEAAYYAMSDDEKKKYKAEYDKMKGQIEKQAEAVAQKVVKAEGDKTRLQLFKGTPGVFGSIFQNFGKGTDATLHGDEAVIPKDSPLGGMLSMMEGDLGSIKKNMFTSDGKMNVSGMMEMGQQMGKKYDSYAKENEGAIKNQGRGLVKSMTNLTDEDLDKMEAQSVKSNNTIGKGTSVNNIGGNMASRLDELIRVNKAMLDELRNM